MKKSTSKRELSQEIKKQAYSLGFDLVGIASIPGSSRLKLRTESLQRWLEHGYQADMNWMQSPKRQNIYSLLENAESIICVGLNYYLGKNKNNELKIAKFAWGNDYHKVITSRLKHLGLWLKTIKPNANSKVCVDSSPLLEKAWAEEAGLGWIGKHSTVINKKYGSWIVLGYLITSEELEADQPAKAQCGSCNKCLELCPTNAIKEPFVVDSKSCIAYHTIENREKKLPYFIEKSMDKWVAGCDICQDVCPWNKKSIKNTTDKDLIAKEWMLNLNESSLNWTEEMWKDKLKDTTLKRIKPWMWKRNISAAIKNKTKGAK
tara:strand:+ start:2032 stop:2988 length:957 start_codon:yes stop_codon:yes gene_type:complete